MAKLIESLTTKINIPPENIHIIGHSLGAHVGGFAGRMFNKMAGSQIGRITALDAAGPLFEGPFGRVFQGLNSQDAKVVDVIHTDAGVFGYSGPLGTVDYYPNGGEGPQPGCTLLDLEVPHNYEELVENGKYSYI